MISRIKITDKRIINGSTDVNQLEPIKYKWAYDKYKMQLAGHWIPEEISMHKDFAQWKDPMGLTEDERLIVKRNLGFFVTADSLAANNIVLGTYRHITAPECRLFLLGQGFVEALHTVSYQYIVESLGLDKAEIFNAYHEIQSIRDKDEFLLSFINTLTDKDFTTGTHENDSKLLKALIVFACIMEGLFFYVGFAQILALGRHGKLMATCEQYQYIMKEECVTPDTQVLTQHGWKCIDNLSECDQVLQYDKETGTSKFVTPSRKVVTDYDGELLHFNNHQGHYDLMVTPNHRMLYQRPDSSLDVKLASELNVHPYMNMVVAGGGVAGDRQLTDIERFAIAFQADGYKSARYNGVKCGTIPVLFSFTKARKQDRLLQLLLKLGFTFKIRVERRGNNRLVYTVNVPIEHIKYIDKTFSWVNLIDVSSHYATEFIDETAEWDGNKPSASTVRYDNTNKKAIDIMIALGVIAGYRVLYKVKSDNRKETFQDMHRVYFVKDRQTIQGGVVNKNKVQYTGKVYCLTVDSGLFYVRRNSAVMITGNSLHSAFGIDMINTIKQENPHLWNESFKQEIVELFKQAVLLEYAYAEDTMPRGILGLNKEAFLQYLQFIANRRLKQIGINEIYDNVSNPFPWMSEMIDLKKEKNFFETRVTEYQSAGGLSWD